MNDYESAGEAIAKGKCVIASTGAGISVESGIPDFRSADGIWSRYDPMEYATIDAFRKNPAKVWKMWYELSSQLGESKPNKGHVALADLERENKLHAVITQNVDNLHQDAGSQKVIEYHGNSRHVRCLSCNRRQRLILEQFKDGTPHCYCGGVFKPDVVMFGEAIPVKAMLSADGYARTADVVIIVGTSAQVFPAAQLPITAKQRGAFIIEANIERTDFTETITDAFLEGPSGETLPRLAEAVLK